MKKYLIFALILIGFTSTLAQILLMRELAVVFYGNELSFGITIAGWLFWTAIGSSLIGRLVDRLKKSAQLFAILQILFPLIIALEIFLVRDIRHILGIVPGVMIGFFPMLISCFFVLLPLCLLTGFLFTLGCKVYTVSKKEVAPQIGYVYIYDGLGDILGGIVFTYVLVYLFHSFDMFSFLFILNLLSGFLILRRFPIICLFLLVLVTLTIFSGLPNFLQQLSQKLQWQGYNLIITKDSIYGNIAISREENQYTFYESGLPIFSLPDKVSAEQLIHFPMVMHPEPKQILIIGGGIAGGLTEILKHPQTEVDYVELDPMVIELSKKYLPKEDLQSFKQSNVHLMDGRLFVKRATKRFDLIIVNLPDPATAQLNRFYTIEFFKEIKNILNPDGIFSIKISSNENYFSEELKNLNGCIYKTLKAVFPSVTIAPGEKLLFFASPQKGVLTYNTQLLARRFTARNIQTTYVDEYYFPYRLLQDRITFVKKAIEDYKGLVNTDFYPIGYFYEMVFWSTQFDTRLGTTFNWFSKINLNWILGILIILFISQLVICKKRPITAIPIAIMTTGYAGLSLEIILIFGFQVLYGYLYHRIGIIVASFMFGLVIGTLWMNQILNKINDKQGIRILSRIEFSIFLYSFLLPLIFLLLSRLNSQASIFMAVEILFPILTIITGIFVGAEFPLANKLYLKNFQRIGKTAGLIYGFDLFGACLGGLLSTILFIPILGIFQCCFISGLLNLTSFILVFKIK
ncbi:MAG: methyltransferase [bacterium]